MLSYRAVAAPPARAPPVNPAPPPPVKVPVGRPPVAPPSRLVALVAADFVVVFALDCVAVTTYSPGVSPLRTSVMVSFERPRVTGTVLRVTSLAGTVRERAIIAVVPLIAVELANAPRAPVLELVPPAPAPNPA